MARSIPTPSTRSISTRSPTTRVTSEPCWWRRTTTATSSSVRVHEVRAEEVVLDLNHPLAGAGAELRGSHRRDRIEARSISRTPFAARAKRSLDCSPSQEGDRHDPEPEGSLLAASAAALLALSSAGCATNGRVDALEKRVGALETQDRERRLQGRSRRRARPQRPSAAPRPPRSAPTTPRAPRKRSSRRACTSRDPHGSRSR